MKAKELMVGDWVLAYGKKTQIVWVGNIHKMAVRGFPSEFMDGEILPIPLTSEILEKNGFMLKPDGWLWCEKEGIEDQNYIFIQFRKGCDEVRLVEFNFVNNISAKFQKIQFVHELQHALKLCGIDKEIEL